MHIYICECNYDSQSISSRWRTYSKNVIFKNDARFSDCISKINNTKVNNAKEIDRVMPMYNLPTLEINHFDIMIDGQNFLISQLKTI